MVLVIGDGIERERSFPKPKLLMVGVYCHALLGDSTKSA
jgi:hypothetical protein